jgi:hypothetical protein
MRGRFTAVTGLLRSQLEEAIAAAYNAANSVT